MNASKKIGLLQVVVGIAAGWVIAQWVPISKPVNSDQPEGVVEAPQELETTKETPGEELDARSIRYAVRKRLPQLAGADIKLKYAGWAARNPRASHGGDINGLARYENASAVVQSVT